MIKTFGRDIYNTEITLKEADEDQSNFLVEIINSKNKVKPQDPEKKKEKENDVLKNVYEVFDGRERVLHAFESKIFPVKNKSADFSNFGHCKLEILTPKPMLQRLPIALTQVKAGNNSERLLNEVRQIVYSL